MWITLLLLLVLFPFTFVSLIYTRETEILCFIIVAGCKRTEMAIRPVSDDIGYRVEVKHYCTLKQQFRRRYPPSKSNILRWVHHFKEASVVHDLPKRGRTGASQQTDDNKQVAFQRSSQRCLYVEQWKYQEQPCMSPAQATPLISSEYWKLLKPCSKPLLYNFVLFHVAGN